MARHCRSNTLLEGARKRMVIGLSTGDDLLTTSGSSATRGVAVQENDSDESSLTDLVEQPAKVMHRHHDQTAAAKVRAASTKPCNRLRDIHATSIRELSSLAPELREGSTDTLPFNEDAVPSADAELRIAPGTGRLAGRRIPRHPNRAICSANGGSENYGKCAGCRCRPGSASRASTATAGQYL